MSSVALEVELHVKLTFYHFLRFVSWKKLQQEILCGLKIKVEKLRNTTCTVYDPNLVDNIIAPCMSNNMRGNISIPPSAKTV